MPDKSFKSVCADFMTSLSDVKQAEIIEAFKSTSRYLDDLLNIDNPYFEGMVNCIYPPELQLNKANTADTKSPFLDLHLSISNGFVSSKIYDKRDGFDFDIVNFPFWFKLLFHLYNTNTTTKQHSNNRIQALYKWASEKSRKTYLNLYPKHVQ